MPRPSNTSRLTIRDAAEYLNCSPDTIRRMISRGDLPAYRYGSKLVRIDPADVEKLRQPVTSTAAYRQDRAQYAGGAS